MFVWTAKTLLSAIARHAPGVAGPLGEDIETAATGQRSQALEKLYASSECVSIDYAVLERADNVIVIKADLAWDDVGSWLALERLVPMDTDNNVVHGQAVPLDTFDTTLYNDTDDLICAFGVSDLVIVRTGRAVMVVHKTRVDDMKRLVEKLKSDEQYQDYL